MNAQKSPIALADKALLLPRGVGEMEERHQTPIQGGLGKLNPANLCRPRIPFFWRFVLVVAAWYLAICMFPKGFAIWCDPEAILPFLCFFPLGLVAIVMFCLGLPTHAHDVLVSTLYALSNVLYITVVGVLLLTPRRKVFWLVYVILLILLTLNVKGCYMATEDRMFGPEW